MDSHIETKPSMSVMVTSKRALRLATLGLTVLTILLLATSLYNLVAFIRGISSEGALGMKLEMNPNTGDFVMTLRGSPSNNGFLDIDLSIRLTASDATGQVIASNSTTVRLPPGGGRPIALNLLIPASEVPGGDIQKMKGTMQLELSVRTLFNTVGFMNVIKVGSEGI